MKYCVNDLVSYRIPATLGIKYEKLPSKYYDSNYNFDELIIRYNDHPSILSIKNKCSQLNSTFTFKKIDKEQISIVIKRLDPITVSQSNGIPLINPIIKDFSEIFGGFLAKNFNECLDKGFSPQEPKCAEVALAYKKKDKKDKNNYRPDSILFNISKLYERCIHQQIN